MAWVRAGSECKERNLKEPGSSRDIQMVGTRTSWRELCTDPLRRSASSNSARGTLGDRIVGQHQASPSDEPSQQYQMALQAALSTADRGRFNEEGKSCTGSTIALLSDKDEPHALVGNKA